MNLPAFRFRPLLLLGAAALVLAGCDGGPTWNEEDPAVGPSGDVVIPKTTNVLDESMVEETLQSEVQGRFGELPDELAFSESAPMEDVEVGDIVVTGVSEKAPAGFLREVTGRREEGGQIILETRPGTLSEAIDKGRLDTNITISEQTIDEKRFYGGIGGKRGVQRNLENQDVPDPVAKAVGGFCDGSQDSICFQLAERVKAGRQFGERGPEVDVGVTYAIAQSFKPSIDLEVDIGFTGTDRVRFSVKRGYRRTVGAILGGGASYELSRDIISDRKLSTFVVTIGPVPVVIIPTIKVEGGVEFALEAAGLEAFVREKKTVENGLNYDGSDWSQIKNRAQEFSGITVKPTEGALEGVTGSVEPFGRVPFSLRLYGAAGPLVAAKGFLQVNVDPGNTDEPLWEAFLGVSGEVGFEAREVGVEESQEIAQAKVPIASGDEPEGESPNLVFPPSQVSSAVGSEEVNLMWVDSGAEEYHVFRAQDTDDFQAEEFFQPSLVEGDVVNPLAPTAGLITRVNEDPIQDTTYTDEGLENGTKYYYRVTAVDEEGNGSEGSEMVTGTPLPDPPDRP